MFRNTLFSKKLGDEVTKINEWKVHGSFHKLYDLGKLALLQRQVIYTREAIAAQVNEIIFNGYKNGGFTMALNFKDQRSASEYIKHFANAGIVTKESISGDNDYLYWLHIQNIDHLTKILDCLSQLDPAVSQIQDDILTQVQPHIQNLPTLSGWIAHGDLSYLMPTASAQMEAFQKRANLSSVRYQESYENCSQQPVVMKLDFLADENHQCKARIYIDKANYANYQDLEKILIRYNLDIMNVGYDWKHIYTFDVAVKNRKELETLLKVLTSIDTAVAEKLRAYITFRYVVTIENKDSLIKKPLVETKNIECQRQLKV